MPGREHCRPVWLTAEDVEYLGGQRSAEARAYLQSKWDAAPADPAEAAEAAVTKFCPPSYMPDEVHEASVSVLMALGYSQDAPTVTPK